MKIGEAGHAGDGMIIGQSPNTGPEAIRHHVTEGCFIQNAGVLAGIVITVSAEALNSRS